jgi:hypothetical protein
MELIYLENPLINENTEKDNKEMIEDKDDDVFQPEWMHLAEMGPNTNIGHNTDLGSRDIDINNNWTNKIRQRYSNDELMDADSFVSRHYSNNVQRNRLDEDGINVSYQNLNENQ